MPFTFQEMSFIHPISLNVPLSATISGPESRSDPQYTQAFLLQSASANQLTLTSPQNGEQTAVSLYELLPAEPWPYCLAYNPATLRARLTSLWRVRAPRSSS